MWLSAIGFLHENGPPGGTFPLCGPVWKTVFTSQVTPSEKSALRTEVPLTGSADSLPSGKSAGKLGNLPQLSMAYGALKNVVIFIAPAEKSLYM